MAKDKTIAIFIGTFDGQDNTYSWNKHSSYENFEDAELAFNKICISACNMGYEELADKYGSPRLDVEIRQGENKLKWFGIYEKLDALEITEDELENQN